MKTEGLTQLRNVYPRSEFIRSLDPLFRPVGVANAPDGTIYIADMYRGVIEGAPWAKEGTYLWEKIKQYQLNKVLGHGRVWRLTYDGMSPDRTRPRMLRETAAQLVRHLSHPNGWWRDTAQQLLVLKQDRSVAPALDTLVRGSKNALARVPRAVDARGTGQPRRCARPRDAERRRSGHADAGHSRQRIPVQSRRYVLCCRLARARRRRIVTPTS